MIRAIRIARQSLRARLARYTFNVLPSWVDQTVRTRHELEASTQETRLSLMKKDLLT